MVSKLLVWLWPFIQLSQASLLFWTTTPIFISPLKEFTHEKFDEISATLGNPERVVFRSKTMADVKYLNQRLTDYHSIYIPMNSVEFENAKDLPKDISDKQQVINALMNISNAPQLIILELESPRVKRKVEQATANETDVAYSEPKDPVLYSAKKEGLHAMIYSSKPPLLRTGTDVINLGKSTLGLIDNRDSYTRLIVTIPISGGKVTLRFKFPWIRDHWFLTSAEYVDANAKNWNLTLINPQPTAPKNFSYHCGGSFTFSDTENDIELTLYDVQVQPDAKNRRFSDVYNCVPFTTIPIWSGLFIAWILLLGTGIGLGSLNSIKTMDKFDNSRTKQLTITTSE